MIILDHRDPRPIYQQIVAGVEELVLRGALHSGEQLPSVRALAMELSINPNTIQRAYLELENRGVVFSVSGKGSFISEELSGLREQARAELIAQLTALAVRARLLGLDGDEFGALATSVYGKESEDND